MVEVLGCGGGLVVAFAREVGPLHCGEWVAVGSVLSLGRRLLVEELLGVLKVQVGEELLVVRELLRDLLRRVQQGPVGLLGVHDLEVVRVLGAALVAPVDVLVVLLLRVEVDLLPVGRVGVPVDAAVLRGFPAARSKAPPPVGSAPREVRLFVPPLPCASPLLLQVRRRNRI